VAALPFYKNGATATSLLWCKGLIRVIKADNVIEYSEIKFFKNIRYRLKISDDRILSSYLSDKNDDLYLFLGEDIKVDISLDEIKQQYLNTVEFGGFVLKT
jgi:hypothetical protein